MRSKKGLYGPHETYMDKFIFDYIDKKTMNNNKDQDYSPDKDKDKKENRNIANNKINKEDITLSNSNQSKSNNIFEKDKIEKNKDIIIKKLQSENAHLKKLLIAYKLNKNMIGKSTEKISKLSDYCLDNKMSTLSANKTNINTSSNLNSHNNDFSNSYSNNISNAKNSYNNNILENMIDRISLIQKNNKNKNKNGESYSVLLTDGNIGRSIKKNKGIRSNLNNNKILITEIKLKKTNTKIKRINQIKMNSLYYNKNNLINHAKDNSDINRNSFLNNYGNITFNSNFEKRKYNAIIKDKLDIRRAVKSSNNSIKLDNMNLIKISNEQNLNNNLFINKNNSILQQGKIIKNKNIKTFNKTLLGNIISYNSLNNTHSKMSNLLDKKRNIKLNKKYNNYHSKSSIADTTKIKEPNKINTSISSEIKKIKFNENEKSINKNNILEKFVLKTENNIYNNNNIYKEKNNFLKNNNNKLKCFKSYTSKIKKIINENMNKNLKNSNNNLRNDNQFINSNKKKNNIFFTINKTIIHNMNNTFNNSNNKNYLSHINNSQEIITNEKDYSSSQIKTPNEINTLNNNVINLKKKLLSKGITKINKYNNRYSVTKTNINNRYYNKVNNK